MNDWEVLTEIVGEENVAKLKQQSAFTGEFFCLYCKKITDEHCKALASTLSKMETLSSLFTETLILFINKVLNYFFQSATMIRMTV